MTETELKEIELSYTDGYNCVESGVALLIAEIRRLRARYKKEVDTLRESVGYMRQSLDLLEVRHAEFLKEFERIKAEVPCPNCGGTKYDIKRIGHIESGVAIDPKDAKCLVCKATGRKYPGV